MQCFCCIRLVTIIVLVQTFSEFHFFPSSSHNQFQAIPIENPNFLSFYHRQSFLVSTHDIEELSMSTAVIEVDQTEPGLISKPSLSTLETRSVQSVLRICYYNVHCRLVLIR